jgi:hypothetical protein
MPDTKKLQLIADNIVYWLHQEHDLKGTVTIESTLEGDRADIAITDEAGEDFYTGNYADPGISVWLFGEADDLHKKGDKIQLVKVNNVIMQALERHIAGWAVGYS